LPPRLPWSAQAELWQKKCSMPSTDASAMTQPLGGPTRCDTIRSRAFYTTCLPVKTPTRRWIDGAIEGIKTVGNGIKDLVNDHVHNEDGYWFRFKVNGDVDAKWDGRRPHVTGHVHVGWETPTITIGPTPLPRPRIQDLPIPIVDRVPVLAWDPNQL